MLVSFFVSNFRSFDEEQTFSLVASNRLLGSHEGHTVPIPNSDDRVLRTGVVYGANGAGKSNLFKALQLLTTIATSTRKKDAPIRRDAFRFGSGPAKPTILDLQFVVGNQVYRYGVKLDDTQVLEEWLARMSHGNEQILYERTTGPNGEVRVELGKISGANEKFKALAKIGGPRNQSFLVTAISTLEGRIPSDVWPAYAWFDLLLHLISPQQSDRNLSRMFAADLHLLDFASHFLNSSSTGIDNLALIITPLKEEEFEALVPEQLMPNRSRLSDGQSWQRTLSDGDVVRVQRDGGGLQYSRLRLEAAHKTHSGEIAPLDLREESDGTRRLLQLIPALHRLKQDDAVYFVDEVDRSLHPMLVRNFLEFFLSSCHGGHRQLIMTTHESSLLDQDLLRRDEIWFAEKDAAGATSLYSLLDFKVRNDLEIRKHYLQGRFGAVPFLGGVQRLMEGEG